MRPLLSLLLLLSLIPPSLSTIASPHIYHEIRNGDEEDLCGYTVYIRTGSIWKGGTDSVISLALAGSDGWGILISDLVSWGGLMGPDYNYYDRGNLDIFSGRGPCLSAPPCWMNLTSDCSGDHHGWYCNYVEVTSTGPHMGCSQKQFTVEQWLATDASPYQLFAVRDDCPAPLPESGRGQRSREVQVRAVRAGA